jgi:uncharacterized protein (DUF2461 family)
MPFSLVDRLPTFLRKILFFVFRIAKFWKNVLSPGIFYPEHQGSMFLRNVRNDYQTTRRYISNGSRPTFFVTTVWTSLTLTQKICTKFIGDVWERWLALTSQMDVEVYNMAPSSRLDPSPTGIRTLLFRWLVWHKSTLSALRSHRSQFSRKIAYCGIAVHM